jgi:hypothetical protein
VDLTRNEPARSRRIADGGSRIPATVVPLDASLSHNDEIRRALIHVKVRTERYE